MRILNALRAVAATVLIVTIAPGLASASLVDRGDGTVFDSVTHLVWLGDWNVNGAHDWATQVSWAENLVFAGSDQWLLPRIDQYLALYVDAGGTSTGIESQFANVQASFDYWSSTDFLGDPAFSALFFPSIGLSQEGGNKTGLVGFATAVREEAVTSAVPEPGTISLLAAALFAGLPGRGLRSRPHRRR
jgi:Protein of unknown function (DUF1566)